MLQEPYMLQFTGAADSQLILARPGAAGRSPQIGGCWPAARPVSQDTANYFYAISAGRSSRQEVMQTIRIVCRSTTLQRDSR